MSDRPDNTEQEPAASPRLIEGLRALSGPAPAVPPAVDQAVLTQARAHLRSIAPRPPAALSGPAVASQVPVESNGPARRPTLVPFPQWLAIAAALVVGFGLAFLFRPGSHGVAPVAREDIDRNGRVDILDAFALARRLQSGAPSAEAGVDVNGDGVFDQRDVDHVAARAVQLHLTATTKG